MLLLTDGSVMCQEQGGLNWKKLIPDAHGSYVNGTWVNLAPMHHTRRYYASAVLRDGRVFVSGGEYSDAGSETNKTEIYDPVTDTWTEIPGRPAGQESVTPPAQFFPMAVFSWVIWMTSGPPSTTQPPTRGWRDRRKDPAPQKKAGSCSRTTQ